MMTDATDTLEPRTSDTAPRHYLRRSLRILAIVVLGVYALIHAKSVLVPLAFAAVVAMLMQGPVGKLASVMPRGIAIGLSALLLAGIVFGTAGLIGQQLADFSSEIPSMEQKGRELLASAQERVAGALGVQEQRVEKRVDEQLDNVTSTIGSSVRGFVGGLTGFLADLFLFFVYYILLLGEQERLKRFVLRKAAPGSSQEARGALDDVIKVAGQYVRGRAFLIAILFGVYALGFWWAGLRFALVVAGISALMSIVPYIGNIAAAGLVVLVAALSDDFANAALIGLGTMALAQVLESYVLTPLIVGKGVDLNALATIIAVVAFGTIWGLPGTILAIPVVAILRQVLQHLPNGEEWAYLLSDSEG